MTSLILVMTIKKKDKKKAKKTAGEDKSFYVHCPESREYMKLYLNYEKKLLKVTNKTYRLQHTRKMWTKKERK